MSHAERQTNTHGKELSSFNLAHSGAKNGRRERGLLVNTCHKNKLRSRKNGTHVQKYVKKFIQYSCLKFYWV